MTSGWGYVDGAIGSNQNIEIKAQTTITGDVYAHGQVDRKGQSTVDGSVIYGPTLDYPTVNYDALRDNAMKGDSPSVVTADEVIPHAGGTLPNVINGDLHLAGGEYTFPANGIVFITGDLKVTSWSTLLGCGTLVVLGETHLSAHLRSREMTPQDTGILLISQGDVKVSAQVCLDAFIYTDGAYHETARTEINGAVIADAVTLTAQGRVNYRRLNPSIMPPPVDDGGDDDTEGDSILPNWAMLSWEQLY